MTLKNKKIYKCVRCGKVLETTKPIRLTKQLYNVGTYKQYSPIEHFDFCKECYIKIENVFKKWRKENESK